MSLDAFRDPRQYDAEPTKPDFEIQQERHAVDAEGFIEQADRIQAALDRDAMRTRPESDDYLALPMGLRMKYSRAEYLWLSDSDKATLVQRECEPEA